MFKDKPVLMDEIVMLRPFIEADITSLLEILAEPGVNNYTGSNEVFLKEKATLSSAEAQKITDWYKTRNEQTDRLDLAIVVDQKIIGEIVVNLYDPKKNQANIRVLISDSQVSKGYGTRAFDLLLPYIFNVVGLRSLHLDVFDFNPRAQHVYQKMGFVAYNRVPDEAIINGCSYDAIEMRLTAEHFNQLHPKK